MMSQQHETNELFNRLVAEYEASKDQAAQAKKIEEAKKVDEESKKLDFGTLEQTRFYMEHKNKAYLDFFKQLCALSSKEFDGDPEQQQVAEQIVLQADKFYRELSRLQFPHELNEQFNDLIKLMNEYKPSEQNQSGKDTSADQIKTAGEELAKAYKKHQTKYDGLKKAVCIISVILMLTGLALFAASMVVALPMFSPLFAAGLCLMISPIITFVAAFSLLCDSHEIEFQADAIESKTATFAEQAAKQCNDPEADSNLDANAKAEITLGNVPQVEFFDTKENNLEEITYTDCPPPSYAEAIEQKKSFEDEFEVTAPENINAAIFLLEQTSPGHPHNSALIYSSIRLLKGGNEQKDNISQANHPQSFNYHNHNPNDAPSTSNGYNNNSLRINNM